MEKGSENGKKTEYHESFRIKSESYFKDGDPTGIWFWYDGENISSDNGHYKS